MKKTKFRFIALASAALGLVTASFAFGASTSFKSASAVEYRPSEIFSAGTGGTVGTTDDGSVSYVNFKLNEKGSVHYRHDLALKWYEASAEESGLANPGAVKYYTMKFSFPEINFTQFSLDYESAEENISKNSTSKNSLVFYYEGGALSAAIRNAEAQPKDDEEEREEWTPAEKVSITGSEIELSFSEEDCDIGEFAVTVNGVTVGKFTNIGGYFLESLSSASSTPRVPITFTADKLASGKTEQEVVMKEINSQTFEIAEGSTTVTDNARPVLVLGEQVHNYTLGKKWSLTYEAVDVCDDSVTVTRRFAMLKAPDENGNYTKPVKDDYNSLTTSTFFMPTSDDGEEEQYVSIYFELDDGTTLTDEEKEASRIYLTWYAAENAVQTLGTDAEAFDYIKVDRRSGGPEYVGVTANEETKENEKTAEADALAAEYQAAVDEATKDLSAGDGSYFYLPSLRGLISSEFADYRNLRFSVYYKKQSLEVGSSASSATSLRYNALRFEVDEEGQYIFKVLATDASSNAMQYYVEGKLVTVSASNIWDIEEIPTFRFTASYTGATIEDPGEQSMGYRDSTYTVDSFDVVALSGYESEYELYFFDKDKLPESAQGVSYSDLVKNTKTYLDSYPNAFSKITKYNSKVTEDDAGWDRTDNKYHWNPDSSLSFVPQDVGFYVVELTVTEARMPGHSVTKYQVIQVNNSIDTITSTTYWLENNITAVVLFSVAAVLFIILIILFVVKPSDKKVEDVDLETLKGKRSKKDNRKE